jgi:hypothetical protein
MTQAEHSESSRQRHAEIRFSASHPQRATREESKKSGKRTTGAGPELAAASAAKDTIR